MARKPTRRRVPCASERRGETSSAALAAMNSRRFIRSSRSLRTTGRRVSRLDCSRTHCGCKCCVANAAQWRKTAMGQNRKSSMRANVFRCSPNNGHRQDTSACPFRANNGSQLFRPSFGSQISRILQHYLPEVGLNGLFERKDVLPVVLHADDSPGFLLRFIVERLGEGADLAGGKPLRWTVSVFAVRIVIQLPAP